MIENRIVPREDSIVQNQWSRREWMGGVAGSAVAGLAAKPGQADETDQRRDPFTYCLNTSTIRGQKLSIVEEVALAAKAGYHGIEPWISELERHVNGGGNLPDLGKRIRDAGLRVESAIGFCEWIVDDENRRKKALEKAKHEMDMVRQIGGTRIAAPPVGATRQKDLSLLRAAERYRALAEVGAKCGVVPQVEVWGFSTTLGRLGECALVAIESGHPQACIMPDVYHLYKGGSGFSGLRLLDGSAMHVFHMNDYPADPPRAKITDADRVYPGDGVAPLRSIIRDLVRVGFRGVLSLELFNRSYWKQDALAVAKNGLQKMQTVVSRSLAS